MDAPDDGRNRHATELARRRRSSRSSASFSPQPRVHDSSASRRAIRAVCASARASGGAAELLDESVRWHFYDARISSWLLGHACPTSGGKSRQLSLFMSHFRSALSEDERRYTSTHGRLIVCRSNRRAVMDIALPRWARNLDMDHMACHPHSSTCRTSQAR